MRRRTRLITVSGIVGSGKSTAVRDIMATLEHEHEDAEYWRFQQLPCFTLRPRPSAAAGAPARGSAGDAAPVIRGRNYRQKRLSLARALGYAARIVAFRAFCRFGRGPRWAVLDRYFYDNFVQYRTEGAGRAAVCARADRARPQASVRHSRDRGAGDHRCPAPRLLTRIHRVAARPLSRAARALSRTGGRDVRRPGRARL